MKGFIVFLLLCFSVGSYGQAIISGRISDGKESLPFCTVQVHGSTNGTITDIDGNFTLGGVLPDDTLVVSFVGYSTQFIPVGNRTSFEITLQPDVQALEEVVVVGFGVQEKINVTGSVVSVDLKKIRNRGVSNVSNILSGQTPGLTVLQRGGSPGRNQGQLRIRGIGTLGSSDKNDPLIIVDGVETGSLTEINPEDIQNISILKDAAAGAIYGVRAANGVIIVTTRRGTEGSIKTNYGFQLGFSRPTSLPEKVNATELAELLNESQKNEGLTTRSFSSADIDLFESGASPYTHANSDQLKEVFDRNGLRQMHNLSFSGGNPNILYNISLGHTREDGLMANTGMKRYNLRSNIDINLTERLSLGINLAGSQRIITDPVVGVGGIIHRAYREWATDPITLENGNWALPNFSLAQGINHNSVALVNEGGSKEFVDTRLLTTFVLGFEPFEFLSIKGIAATVQDFNKRSEIAKALSLYNVNGSLANTTQSSVLEGRDNIADINLQLLVNLEKQLRNHSFKGLLGFNSREIETSLSSLSALDLRSNDLDQINAADLTQDAIFGNTTEYRLLSYFGRFNYGYSGRYLFEANLRYDGTSRFSKSNRFNTFPSLSVGWRISEEDFFDVSVIEELKLRVSWGRLGNQEIGDYRYLNTYVFDQTAIIGNVEQGGATERVPLGNADIVWESTEVNNIGLDLMLMEGKITFSGDYFIRKTSDVLIQKPLAAVFGTGVSSANFPFVNAASTKNQGFELDLNYTDVFGDLNFSCNLNFSRVTTEITDLAGTDQPGFSVGDPIANIFGYEALGIFQNQDEVDNHADQSALGPASAPGDIKYKDITGPDGFPDGLINDLDRKNLGSFFPQINYGLSFRLEYKGFDFSSLWQGVADVEAEIGGRQRQPFFLGSSPWKLHMDRANISRDGDVINADASYPRTLITGNTKNYVTSSWWVKNTAFLKLRNAQLGYTIPYDKLENFNISNMRIYVSGENLLTFTHFEGFDPEIPTTGSALPIFDGNTGYPVTRTYLIGLNLSF